MIRSLLARLQRSPHPPPVVTQVKQQNLTYLGMNALEDLHEIATEFERKRIQGAFVEAGCALGGSAIVIAAAKSTARPLYVYDVFGMIPPPSAADGPDVHARYDSIRQGEAQGIGGQSYYGYDGNLYETVRLNFERLGFPVDSNNVHLIRGLFQDTMPPGDPVALAHIDGDWYESVTTCLERLVPLLVRGGVLVIDDYDTWSGCRLAVDRFFTGRSNEYKFRKRSRLQIVKR